MTYSDCDHDRPTTPESRLRDALETDVARHHAEICDAFTSDWMKIDCWRMWFYRSPRISAASYPATALFLQQPGQPLTPRQQVGLYIL